MSNENLEEYEQFITQQDSDGEISDFEEEELSEDSDDGEDLEDNSSDYSEGAGEWEKRFNPTVYDFLKSKTQIKEDFGLSSDATPLSILRKFITDSMIQDIILESDRYTNQVKQTKPKAFHGWKKFDLGEFWTFFAVKQMMGLIKKPSLRDYWSSDPLFATPFFSNTMSRNRFMDIQRSLHFVNNLTVPKENKDRFVKLGNFMINLIVNFRSAINPGEFLCLDESLMGYKGRLAFKQYNAMKRSRFGIKFFVLVDCKTKFVLEILPYQGQSTAITFHHYINEFGFGGAAVLTLLNNYFYSCHKVVIDNYFNSPKLAEELLDRSTYVLGTAQKRRKGMPKLPNMICKLAKGEIRTFSNGRVLIERWIDRRDVVMLNTFMPSVMQDSVSSNPKNTREKPGSVLLYNTTMGALDDVDRQIKPYQTIRKAYKWYIKVAFHLLDLAVYNSYVIYCTLKNKKPTYVEYIRILIREIIDTFPIARKAKGRPSNTPSMNKMSLSEPVHLPIRVTKQDGNVSRSDCYYCKSVTGIRSSTVYQCELCKKRLCVQGRNCFQLFHNKLKKSIKERATDREVPSTSNSHPMQNESEENSIMEYSESEFFNDN